MELLVKVFAEVLNIRPEEVTDTLSYKDDDRWDSVEHMKIIAKLEHALGIEIETQDIIGMETVGKAREILKKYVKVPQAG